MNYFTPPRLCLILVAAVLAVTTGAAGAAAETKAKATKAKVLGSFDEWKALSYEEGGQKVCYMSSQPKKLEPKNKVRGDAYVLVTHRPAEKSFGVVSVTAGYKYQKDSEVTVKVGPTAFKLFTDGDTAWARDEATDKALSNAIRNGKSMVVKATSSKGTNTTDTYSLNGAGSAYQAIGEACGAKK